MIRTYRCMRAAVRHAIKPIALWLNAIAYRRSEDDAQYAASLRELAIERERSLRRKQLRLQLRRREIAGW